MRIFRKYPNIKTKTYYSLVASSLILRVSLFAPFQGAESKSRSFGHVFY